MASNTQSNARVATSEATEVGRLTREVAEHRTELEALREQNAAIRAALAAVQAQVMGQHDSAGPNTAPSPRDQSPKRRLRRRAPAGSGEGEAAGLVSRRRLFGLLGGAAAVGTGLAVAGSTLAANPAGATIGTMAYGTTNDAGTALTSLTSADAGGATLYVANTATGQTASNGTNALQAFAQSGDAVAGNSVSGYGVTAQGNLAPLWLSPAGSGTGPPASGTYQGGELYVDSVNALFYCVVAGTPGTWINLSAPLVTLASPARVYDSRVGQLPATGPKSQITNGVTVSVDVTGTQAAGGPSGVPVTATAVLGNLTVTNSGGAGFLTVYANGGTQPATSNINMSPGITFANNFTSGVNASNHKISVTCGAGPTDFIIDIFGYYP